MLCGRMYVCLAVCLESRPWPTREAVAESLLIILARNLDAPATGAGNWHWHLATCVGLSEPTRLPMIKQTCTASIGFVSPMLSLRHDAVDKMMAPPGFLCLPLCHIYTAPSHSVPAPFYLCSHRLRFSPIQHILHPLPTLVPL